MPLPSPSPTQRRRATAVSLACLAVLAGCVERKMMLRSDPPGALIALDGADASLRTPAEVPFDYGGARSVTLIAPGHRVLDTTVKLADPWFTYFPLDIAAEFLWPGTIEDVQTFDFKLEPYAATTTADEKAELKKRLQELKLRAAKFRAGGSQGPKETAPPAGEANPK